MLSFEPRIPKQWDGYSFKVNFRNQILKVTVEKKGKNATPFIFKSTCKFIW